MSESANENLWNTESETSTCLFSQCARRCFFFSSSSITAHQQLLALLSFERASTSRSFCRLVLPTLQNQPILGHKKNLKTGKSLCQETASRTRPTLCQLSRRVIASVRLFDVCQHRQSYIQPSAALSNANLSSGAAVASFHKGYIIFFSPFKQKVSRHALCHRYA